MPFTRVALATLIPLVLALTACDEVEDRARDAADRAGCAAAQQALDTAQDQAEQALDEIDTDPAAARRKLAGMRDAVRAAESGVSGETQQKLSKARQALGRMADEAADAAEGADVDTSAVDDAKSQLDSAVSGVRDLC